MSWGLLAYVFTAGMVATVNPCGLAMLPAYLSYYLAVEEEADLPWGLRLVRALAVGASVTLGFLVLFGAVGFAVTLGARALIAWVPWIGLGIGLGLIGLGVGALLGRVPTLSLPALRVRRSRTPASLFAFGVAYGTASLTCTLPVFLAVVGTAFVGQGLGVGLGRFLAYGLGMGAVFTSLAVAVALLKGWILGQLRALFPYVRQLAALFLIGSGGYLVYYWLIRGGLLARMLG